MVETIRSRVIRIWLSAAVAALVVSGLIGGLAAASPIGTGVTSVSAAAPTVTAPATARPGEAIQIVVANAPLNPAPPVAYCVGIYGPGKLIEPEQAPFFRVGIGMVSVGADGSGRGSVTLPTDLAGGVYQLVVGGCPPHPGLAPLAWFAATNLTVVVAAAPPAVAKPPRLPPSGGVPGADLGLLGGAGLGLTLAGLRLRRPRRG